MPNRGTGLPAYVDMGAFERQADTAAPDLAVTLAAKPAPEFLNAGGQFTVQWSVGNVGLAKALGPWEDVVYLSSDPYLNSGDLVLGRRVHSGALSPGASYSETLTANAPGAAGVYYVLVETNAGRSFIEPVESNNVLAASGVVAVDLPILTNTTPVTGTVRRDGWTYLRYEAAAGQSVILGLDVAGDGATGLLARYGAPPTLTEYDAKVAVVGQPDQELRLLSPYQGSYYIGIRGDYLPSGAASFTLSATPIDWAEFEKDVKPDGIDPDTWSAVFARLKTQVGPTWGDYAAALRHNAARWAAAGYVLPSPVILSIDDASEKVVDVVLSTGARISGTLLNRDGTPIVGADISASTDAGDPVFATTDAAGHYYLTGLSGGECWIVVSAAGYATQLRAISGLVLNELRQGVDFSLEPGQLITGQRLCGQG